MKKLSLFFFALAISAMALATDYKLVTKASDLKAGKHYVIGSAASGNAVFVSTTSNTNNRKTTAAIAVSGGYVTATDEVMTFTLDSTASGYTFATDNYLGTAGYLNATSTDSKNYLKVVTNLDAYAYFSIAVATDGKATVTCLGKETRNIMRYNTDGMFACYSSGQNDIYLYVEAIKPSNVPVTAITADNDKDTVQIGDKLTLNYTIAPDSATDQRVAFAITSGAEFATLNEGALTGVAEGNVVVTVTALDSLNQGDKLSATYNIHVKGVTLNTCAEVNAAAKGDALKLNPVTAVYVNGANIYVKDASGSTLVYINGHSIKAGDAISGIKGTVDIYNGLPELKPTSTTGWTITPGAAPAIPEALAAPTAAEVNQVLEWKGVKGMSGEFTTATKTTIKGAFGTDSIAFYNNFKIAQTFDATHSYDITGAVAIYTKDEVTTIQAYFISAKDNGTITTALKNTEAKQQVRKAMIGGQMVIIRDGKMFNALGSEL